VGLVPENELSKNMGVELESVTNGPSVNESLETSVAGVFACGNVLHVHDLVDFVSEEAAAAGKNAAQFVKEGNLTERSKDIILKTAGGVRYTVPKTINVNRMEEKLTVRFRVDQNYKNRYVSVYCDDERIAHRKKQMLAPGEMEQVILSKAQMQAYPNIKNITIKLEEA
jgi:pyruvate/2-oxoglutarate dehydrogenase complex dihydrolipoamide dehydrogenase (E3) component